MKYGKELAEIIKAEIKATEEVQKRRNERIANWETDEDDCFLSIRVEEQSLAKCRMQLAILETDGCMDYEAIFDENDKEVYVHGFKNKWGGWSVVGNGIFGNGNPLGFQSSLNGGANGTVSNGQRVSFPTAFFQHRVGKIVDDR